MNETFLKTPFYDPSQFPGSSCKNGGKFQNFKSPFDANDDVIDLNQSPTNRVAEFYLGANVSLKNRRSGFSSVDRVPSF